MKLIYLTVFLLAFSSCNSQSTKPSDKKASEEKDIGQKDIAYPYPISYSAKFKFIDPERGKMVLSFCKNFENNSVDNSKSIFADSVIISMPNLK